MYFLFPTSRGSIEDICVVSPLSRKSIKREIQTLWTVHSHWSHHLLYPNSVKTNKFEDVFQFLSMALLSEKQCGFHMRETYCPSQRLITYSLMAFMYSIGALKTLYQIYLSYLALFFAIIVAGYGVRRAQTWLYQWRATWQLMSAKEIWVSRFEFHAADAPILDIWDFECRCLSCENSEFWIL
jgi:hypothetical protein